MWKTININKEQIKDETIRAYLIKMPNNSDYKGYCFWHPKSLVRNGKHKNALAISYTDDFVFKISKYSHGTIVKDEINADMFEDAFEVINSNIQAPLENSYLVVEEPKAIDPTVEVKECLKNNK